KRDILFNLDQPVEVPLDEFNSKWWPLILNVWVQFNYKIHTNRNS
ncbi:4577_t:CDS:1, partial [Racocetra persica]